MDTNLKWLTLKQIKAQLRLDDQQAYEEHDLLEMYGESAEETVLELCNRTYDEIQATYGGTPKNLVHASLMLVDMSYQYRSPASMQSISLVPYTFDMLIKPYIKL
jgi:hypothetical protein